MRALPRQRGIQDGRVPFRPAPGDREVLLRDPLLLHEQTKTPRRGCSLRHEHESAGLAVQAIDDRYLSAVSQLEGEEVSQFSPKGASAVRFCGMNEQKRRLIDDRVIGCLRDEREGRPLVCAIPAAGG